MEISILGHKIKVLNLVIILVVGMIIGSMTLCSCSKVTLKEALENATTVDGKKNEDKKNGEKKNAEDELDLGSLLPDDTDATDGPKPTPPQQTKKATGGTEPFTLMNAAPINHQMNDTKNSWSNNAFHYAANMNNTTAAQKQDSYKGPSLPLEDTLSFFKGNQFKPECCPSNYSSSDGCACETTEQTSYLNERAGNRDVHSNYF